MSNIIEPKRGVAIGTFDGVHIGHQRILQRLHEVAMKEHLQRMAYTFVTPPRFTFEKETQGLLLPEWAKVRFLERYVQEVKRVNFEDVAFLSAEEFVQNVLFEDLGARAILVGENFRFGHGRIGDVELLRDLCRPTGTEVIVVPSILVDGVPVSSTRIRLLVSRGKMGEARRLLGRPPIIVGQVVHGDQLGRALGYPTANLIIDDGILPPGDGIYLVKVFWSGGKSPGLLYAGKRPSMGGKEHRLEVHLLTAKNDSLDHGAICQDLYGAILEAQILERIRDDQYFPTLSKLRHQMAHDVEHARELLVDSKWPEESIIT